MKRFLFVPFSASLDKCRTGGVVDLEAAKNWVIQNKSGKCDEKLPVEFPPASTDSALTYIGTTNYCSTAIKNFSNSAGKCSVSRDVVAVFLAFYVVSYGYAAA